MLQARDSIRLISVISGTRQLWLTVLVLTEYFLQKLMYCLFYGSAVDRINSIIVPDDDIAIAFETLNYMQF